MRAMQRTSKSEFELAGIKAASQPVPVVIFKAKIFILNLFHKKNTPKDTPALAYLQSEFNNYCRPALKFN